MMGPMTTTKRQRKEDGDEKKLSQRLGINDKINLKTNNAAGHIHSFTKNPAIAPKFVQSCEREDTDKDRW